jgi:rare lipoprotein A
MSSRNEKISKYALPIIVIVLTSNCSYVPNVANKQAKSSQISVLQNDCTIEREKGYVYKVKGKRYKVLRSARGYKKKGVASWYGPNFDGKSTACGETYDMLEYTAAHKTLPLPSYLRVKNLKNGASVIVKVNDRGPFKDNRIIDLSYAAAKGIGMLDDGTTFVELTNITRQEAARSMYYENKSSIAKEKIAAITQLSNNIYLQIGAFKTKSNARKLKRHIEEKDIDNVYMERVWTKIGILYRVRIGPVNGIERYDEIVKLLISLSLDITLVTN